MYGLSKFNTKYKSSQKTFELLYGYFTQKWLIFAMLARWSIRATLTIWSRSQSQIQSRVTTDGRSVTQSWCRTPPERLMNRF